MVFKECFVPSCNNNSENSPTKLFITLPNAGDPRREEWFKAVGFGKSGAIPKALCCCEDHFDFETDIIDWMYYRTCGQNILLKKDVVPHKNILNKTGETAESHLSGDAKKRKVEHLATFQKHRTKPRTIKYNEKVSKESSQQTQHMTYISPESLISCRRTNTLSAQNDISLGCNPLDLHKIHKTQVGSQKKGKLHSIGLKSGAKFNARLTNANHIFMKYVSEVSIIDARDVLMTITKILRNEPSETLANDFGVTVSKTEKIFATAIPILAKVARDLIFRSDDTLKSAQSIVDCLEIRIAEPPNPILRSLTWSACKECNTFKYLISVSPDGVIDFISGAFGGSTSDADIFKQSGVLGSLHKETEVLTDRGFTSLVAKDFVELSSYTSSEKADNVDTSSEKAEDVDASVRLHVEKTIRRLRKFKMLSRQACIPKRYLHVVTEIVTIACGLVNVKRSVVRKYL